MAKTNTQFDVFHFIRLNDLWNEAQKKCAMIQSVKYVNQSVIIVLDDSALKCIMLWLCI